MQANPRISNISEYHFHKIDLIKKVVISQGKNVTDLSIGDPDLPVHPRIEKALINSLTTKDYNKYPPYEGIEELKRSIIRYYNEVFSVKLNMNEVCILIGSKEGISNLIPAVCDIGDYAIVLKPSYPVYDTCCRLWGVNTINIPLSEKDYYLPDMDIMEKSITDKCRLLILNYPNNPTGAVADKEFYENIIKFCKEHNLVIYNDGAYNEIIETAQAPVSILQCDREKYSIEFGTFSKTFNMTGYRIGYAVGNAEIIQALIKVKSNVDSGQFIPIQYAAIEALSLTRNYAESIREIYWDRRKALEQILIDKNLNFFHGKGTFYIWCSSPDGYTSTDFCEELLYKYGILVTPGSAFDNQDIRHFRIALTKSKEDIVSAFNQIG